MSNMTAHREETVIEKIAQLIVLLLFVVIMGAIIGFTFAQGVRFILWIL